MTIRPATAEDQAEVEDCVNQAYQHYIERMGTRPAPMLADYAALIESGGTYVIDRDGVVGVIVLEPARNHLFIENVAVRPDLQGSGFGRRLIQFAEDQARQRGLEELRLYTNEVMTENLAFYARLGFEIVERRVEDGYRRIYMRKLLDAESGAKRP